MPGRRDPVRPSAARTRPPRHCGVRGAGLAAGVARWPASPSIDDRPGVPGGDVGLASPGAYRGPAAYVVSRPERRPSVAPLACSAAATWPARSPSPARPVDGGRVARAGGQHGVAAGDQHDLGRGAPCTTRVVHVACGPRRTATAAAVSSLGSTRAPRGVSVRGERGPAAWQASRTDDAPDAGPRPDRRSAARAASPAPAPLGMRRRGRRPRGQRLRHRRRRSGRRTTVLAPGWPSVGPGGGEPGRRRCGSGCPGTRS